MPKIMSHIPFHPHTNDAKNPVTAGPSFSLKSADPEFEGIPSPTEEEAANDIQARIEELRAFIKNQ